MSDCKSSHSLVGETQDSTEKKLVPYGNQEISLSNTFVYPKRGRPEDSDREVYKLAISKEKEAIGKLQGFLLLK